MLNRIALLLAGFLAAPLLAQAPPATQPAAQDDLVPVAIDTSVVWYSELVV